MMVLNTSGSGADPATSATTTTNAARSMHSNKNASLRRRRSKGTIAGFAFGKSGESSNSGSSTSAPTENNVDAAGSTDVSGSISGNSTTGAGNQAQHTGDSSSTPAKPCHAARLALMCCQNAIRMGARTQLGLCPPGRARRGLKAALRQKARSNRVARSRLQQQQQPPTDTGGYFGVDKMLGSDILDDYLAQEEDFLVTTNTFDAESDEEASSGDDDDLCELEELLKEDSPALDDDKKYASLSEPLFTPIGVDNALANSAGGQLSGPMATGKLPFNRRKMRYFDSITAPEKMAARGYLTTESRRSKQREVVLLAKHLKRAQRQERRRIKEERGISLDERDLSDPEDETKDSPFVSTNVLKFEHAMLPATGAAFLLESLSLNPLESVEGMANCYEGIVAAGVAILEANVNDPMSSANETGRHVGTRSEIMAALAPLLITSLEQPSGDVILSLARLRRMCGTARYQRRFVQRLAPSLIRPPKGAMWCLRHQNDMEPILAAAELIFDSASEIFSKGWYDRGQLLLADSKRAETLNAAAMQLRNLSTVSGDALTLGNTLGGHGGWRASRVHKEGAKGANDSLAEWEVIAVDKQIRVSISNIISMDWSKVVVQSRDAELARSYHRARKSSNRTSALPSATSGDMSPKPMTPTPLSPTKPSNIKSPPSPIGPGIPSVQKSANDVEPAESRAKSPIVPVGPPSGQPPPISPPPPNRAATEDFESKLPSDSFPPNLFPPSSNTPPRSPTPKSPKRQDSAVDPPLNPHGKVSSVSPLSPRFSSASSASQIKQSISGPVPSSPGPPSSEKHIAPLSPSSVGTGASIDTPARFMSSASSVASSLGGTMGTQPAHYRMLTSTAAERKRTVAACRALRAQITRFEDAFVQLHGRPPKGAAERAPLATTYAQYREWKRAIRADAACRIQALFRGARSRWRLLRSNDPLVSRIVMARAGRQGFSITEGGLQNSGEDDVLNELSIPSEIGESVQERNEAGAGGIGAIGPDGFPIQSAAGQTTLTPQWGNQIVRRRSGEANDIPNTSSSPVPRPTTSPSSGASVSSTGSGDMTRLSLPDLQAHKRDLKQQLKQYDMNFARRHGRMPVKAEKEPIRHLYERYNALKSHIGSVENEGSRSSASSPVSIQQSSTVLSQRTQSPVSGSDSGGEESPVTIRRTNSANRTPPAASSTPTGAPSQDLAALKAEKGRLHQMLRSYEKDFFKEHKRQVSSFADIRPVASQYRRYKEIKKAITALQQSGER